MPFLIEIKWAVFDGDTFLNEFGQAQKLTRLLRFGLGFDARLQCGFGLLNISVDVFGVKFKGPIGKEKCALAIDYGVELFAFRFAEAVLLVFAVDAFVVLPNDEGIGLGIMAKDEGLFFKFNAAGKEQHSEAGNEFLHHEKRMRAGGATGKGKTCGAAVVPVRWRYDDEG